VSAPATSALGTLGELAQRAVAILLSDEETALHLSREQQGEFRIVAGEPTLGDAPSGMVGDR